MDIRYQLAEDVAGQIGAELYPGRCLSCEYPLLIKPEQGLPFCWFCAVDRVAAQRARTVLTKARMAARGIVLETSWEPPPAGAEPDAGHWWPDGVPL